MQPDGSYEKSTEEAGRKLLTHRRYSVKKQSGETVRLVRDVRQGHSDREWGKND